MGQHHSLILPSFQLHQSRKLLSNRLAEAGTQSGDADFQKACELITAIDWESLLCEYVDETITQWSNCFLGIME